MKQIIPLSAVGELSEKLRAQRKTIVLAGGVFDIVHIGHIHYLENAKKHGDILIVFVESDQSAKKYKGANRPIHAQVNRAKIIAALRCVDYVISLSGILANDDYDKLILSIKPAIIATTKADPNQQHKERQAALFGARVVAVTDFVKNHSTSRLARVLEQEL